MLSAGKSLFCAGMITALKKSRFCDVGICNWWDVIAVCSNYSARRPYKVFEIAESAKELVKGVVNLCKAGRFHITKFILNIKELLLSITETNSRIYVKDRNFPGQLCNKERSEICWEIGDDAFIFKIMFGKRFLTKWGIMSAIRLIYEQLGLTPPFILEGFFRNFVSRMWKGMLRFAMMCSKAGVIGKRTWRRSNSCMCGGASNLQILTILSISLHYFSAAFKLGYEQCSYIGWSTRKAKFIALCC